MGSFNLRKATYFSLFALRGQPLGAHYERILREDEEGIPPDTTKRVLIDLLAHCKKAVPYYSGVMRDLGDSFREDPEDYLQRFPILSRDMLRSRFEELKSEDLAGRKWYLNSTGGSTGEPVQFIQDKEYATRAGAITLLFSRLAGREVGECEARIWGSERDIIHGSQQWRARVINKITNTFFLNAFCMTPERMRKFISVLNARRPKLIVAYATSIYELARFSEREGLEVTPQAAVMTSAETLYPFMREKIEKVFGCRVFNRYGSREVGDVACERPGYKGLWVGPWGNYVEIVDNEGKSVPDGTEGEILVTSLTNYAFPLIRYRIGDRGIISMGKNKDASRYCQMIQAVLGRSLDLFKTRNGIFVDPGYFDSLLYFRDWVQKYQVIQKDYSSILFRIIRPGERVPQKELDGITADTKRIMGDDCKVIFEFVEDIPVSGSGKYRYQISEVKDYSRF